MTALELRGISHRFAGEPGPTLVDIDLTVEEGTMLAVVGPSGSGKTTLLRVTAGLTRPDAGEVLLAGRTVAGLPPEDRGLTVMFQQPHLFEHLSVLDNVAFGPRARGVARREAREAARRYLDLVCLAEVADRRPRELSGGQQQRVALARALATERNLLLLDEPFSSLDRELRTSMHRLLHEARAALSPTVVMVTHDLDEASMADRVAVLAAGRVEQVGPVEDLYARPATLLVARLAGGFNELPGHVVDDEHHSVWGRLPSAGSPVLAGPATLLIRREQLSVRRAWPGSGAGHLGGSGAPGRVTTLSRVGPRQVAEVELDVPAGTEANRLQVELDLDQRLSVGDQVQIALGASSRPWAVPDADPPGQTPHVPSPATRS